jgi:hypothetical protein
VLVYNVTMRLLKKPYREIDSDNDLFFSDKLILEHGIVSKG